MQNDSEDKVLAIFWWVITPIYTAQFDYLGVIHHMYAALFKALRYVGKYIVLPLKSKSQQF